MADQRRLRRAGRRSVTVRCGPQGVSARDKKTPVAPHLTAASASPTLRNNVLPIIGAERIVELRRADVAKLHRKRAATPYQANNALSVISAVWNGAAKRDEVTLPIVLRRTSSVIVSQAASKGAFSITWILRYKGALEFKR
jgi:hypothetical protein